MKYFPDNCHKRIPSKKYFWKVFYALKRPHYENIVNDKILFLKKKNKIKDDKVVATEDAINILKNFSYDDNLSLLS